MQPLVLGPLVAECNDRLSSLRRHAESCADLGCWVRSTSVLTEQFLKTQNPQIGALLGKEALVFSGLRHKYDDPAAAVATDPLHWITVGQAGHQRPTLTPLADGFRITNTYPVSGSLAFKSYKLADVTTPQIIQNVRREFPVGPDWDYLY